MTAIPKPKRELDDAYMEWIKTQPCLIAKYHTCDGDFIDPHHVIPDGQGKTGSKVDDRRCVPLCRKAHDLAKRRDWFESQFPIVFEYEIERLNAKYHVLGLVKPKRVRKQRQKVELSVRHCESCGQSHQIPEKKLTRFGAAIRFQCPRSNAYVSWRVSA